MSRLIFFVVFLILLSLNVGSVVGQATADALDIERIQSATVYIMQAYSVEEDLVITCVGSGTIVNRSGLILTNAHNTVSGSGCSGDILVIALSIRPNEPPVPKYRAEIVQVSPGLDLALLRIISRLDGRLIESGTLALPFVELGNSDLVDLDETIVIIGYSGIGSSPVGVERGTVNSFVAEPSGGEKSWIKTSASIPGVMSGGGAYNREGQLIGIPTTAPIMNQSRDVACRFIQDSNRDGLINDNDICIPIGGFINALRPSNFARPLLRAASLGLTVTPLMLDTVGQGRSDDIGQLSNLFFSPAVVDGMPTTVISSLPLGSSSLYLFFDYENMSPEAVYELRVTVDGIPNQVFSLAPVRWSGGKHGLWYIGSSGQPWPPGVYEFTLVVNGIANEAKRLVVGGPVELNPMFSNIVFGIQDARGNILGNAYVLPKGNIASARFIYQNMENGAEWTEIWYYNGTERRRNTTLWEDGESGSKTISIEVPEGLPSGNYRLTLYLGSNLAAVSDFAIAGAQQGVFPEVFVDPHFTTGGTPAEAVKAQAIKTLSAGVSDFYVTFDWQQIMPGTLWTMRWLVDGDIFYEQTTPWSGPESGQGFWVNLAGTNGIPDGTYRMDLLVNNVQLNSSEVQIGIGQLPIDRFAQASGIQLRGQIRDADTREGIPGVTFILISADFSVEDFVWDANQIYALATTDRNGYYQIDRPLDVDTPYSVMIAADGYLPIAGDGFTVTTKDPNPLDMIIELTRG